MALHKSNILLPTMCKKYPYDSNGYAYSYVYSMGEMLIVYFFGFKGNKLPVDLMNTGVYGQVLWDSTKRWVKLNVLYDGTFDGVSTVADSAITSWELWGTFCARGKVRDEADGWGAHATGFGWYDADAWVSRPWE